MDSGLWAMSLWPRGSCCQRLIHLRLQGAGPLPMPSGWPEDTGPKPPCPPAPASLSAQGSREPGEMLPRKLKQVLRRELWSSFERLLTQGMKVRWLFCFAPTCASGPWGVWLCRLLGRLQEPGGEPAPSPLPTAPGGRTGTMWPGSGPLTFLPCLGFLPRSRRAPGPGQAYCLAHIHSCPEHSWAQHITCFFSEFAKAVVLGLYF